MIETLLSSLGLVAETITRIIKIVQPKVSVVPKKIKLERRDWEIEGYFTICNKTENPLYSVQVLLWLYNDDTVEPTFPLKIKKIENQEKDPETSFGPIIVNTNILVIDGEVKDHKIKLLQIGYLAPKECRRVFYSFDSQLKGEVVFQAFNVSREPQETLKTVNSFGAIFEPPREIKLLSASFFMKRKA